MTKTTKRSLIAICIVILLAAVCLAVMPKALAFAQEASVLNASAYFGGGSGTVSDPYIIKNETQLNNIRNFLSYDGATQAYRIKASFKLASTIILTDTWTPIPGYFDGTFDGVNYTIDYLNIEVNPSSGQYFGLFEYIANGTVKDLFLDKVTIKYSSEANTANEICVGSVAGMNAGTITNCFIEEGSLSTMGAYNGYTAGIAGKNIGVISYCTNYATVTGCGYTGGIAGINGGSGLITSCKNYGTIEFSRKVVDSYTGGIVGKNVSDATVESCHNGGDIKYVGPYWAASVKPCAGQIIGWYASGYFNINNNSWNGKCSFSPLNSSNAKYCSTGAVGRWPED